MRLKFNKITHLNIDPVFQLFFTKGKIQSFQLLLFRPMNFNLHEWNLISKLVFILHSCFETSTITTTTTVNREKYIIIIHIIRFFISSKLPHLSN